MGIYTIAYYGYNIGHSNPTTYTINSATINLSAPGGVAGSNYIGWVDGADTSTDPWLGIYMPDNVVTSIPAGSTGNRVFYAWYEPVPAISNVYFYHGGSGWSNSTNVGDFIDIYFTAPLGSGCHPGLVRGGGAVNFTANTYVILHSDVQFNNVYYNNSELYNLNQGWIYSTTDYSQTYNGITAYFSATLSGDGRMLRLTIYDTNATNNFITGAASNIYFQASGHWRSIGGNWYDTSSKYNGNWSIW